MVRTVLKKIAIPLVIAGTVVATNLFGFVGVASAWTPSSPQVAVSVFGGTGADVANSVAVDSSGNIYTTGSFTGTADFDPGAGITNLTSAGGLDVFVSKLDATGNLVWAKTFGGADPGGDGAYSVAVDSSGNVYTTGFFRGTVDFDPGADTTNLTSAGSTDVFVSKLDASGNLVWAKKFGGADPDGDGAYSVAVDSSGNVYTTGWFRGTVNFGSGAVTSAGEQDVFVSKLDASGILVWAKTFGDTSTDLGLSVAVDSSGNVYTTGRFRGTVNFGSGDVTSAGDDDVFVSKLNATTGNLVWAKTFGGTLDDGGGSVAVDSSGNVYTTGFFTGTADFDPDPTNAVSRTSVGGVDVFVSKLNATGNLVWAGTFGDTSTDQGRSVAVDSSGNIYTTGPFRGTADFDPGAGTTNLTSAGNYDVFVSKLNATTGNLVWARSFGGTLRDEGNSLVVDSSGNIYTTGRFQGTADFDPGAGTINLTSAGDYDVFVSKLDASGVALVPAPAPAPAPATPLVPVIRVSLDIGDGSCMVNGIERTGTFTYVSLGYSYLPGPSDCTKNGAPLVNWAAPGTNQTAAFPLLIDPSDGKQRFFVAQDRDLVAVWASTPPAQTNPPEVPGSSGSPTPSNPGVFLPVTGNGSTPYLAIAFGLILCGLVCGLVRRLKLRRT